MRGKGGVQGLHLKPWRITPAYAGKSFPQNRINIIVEDHPRLCGEKVPSLGSA